ncbi:MAG: hypothetical protein A3I66_10605 [Burkholderiales bacterium RIFCSPLOWO2_02_FULL_57_36]|nr:MAG: hypothetical protein A3I66_10605 [Burkholderiales bacterium RIFCSPLOWO2_02_FULL_57_36]
MESGNIAISLHSNSVPHFVNGAMDQLYQHMHSSLAYHGIYGHITQDTSTYVARKNGEIVAVILFCIENGKLRVLNEQLRLEADEIQRFSDYIFNTCQSVHVVTFPVIENTISRLSFPYQQSLCTQDIVLTMPESVEAYLHSLGKSTRNYVKRYQNKLKRDFPSMTCKTYGNHDASEQHIRDICALNRARMANRCTSSYIDDAETERLIKLVRICGLVTVITINGSVCAGTINYRFGENYFLKVIAHDPAYDEYGLGTLCCYLTICECIARKGKEYHFLWGRYEYKFRLLGIQRDLSHLAIYRSRLHMFLNGRDALKLAYNGRMYGARDWMELKMRRMDNSTVSGKLAFHFLNNLKKMKRTVARWRARRHASVVEPASLQKE